MRCPVCGSENETGAVFCYQCGSALRPGAAPEDASLEQKTDSGRNQQALGDAGGGSRVYQVPSGRPAAPYVVGPATTMTQTSNLATFALILGILSWIFLPFVGAIGAVITGHMGRRQIRESNGQLTGQGLATAGLVLGYLNIALSLLVLVIVCVLPLLIAAGTSTR